MKTVKLEQLRYSIIFIKPVYTAEGNATEILLNDGTIVLDPRGLKSVHRALARLYAVDLQAQRIQVEDMLHRRGTLPFYLEKQVFVPLKLRRGGDG